MLAGRHQISAILPWRGARSAVSIFIVSKIATTSPDLISWPRRDEIVAADPGNGGRNVRRISLLGLGSLDIDRKLDTYL
jgi:hypothetical protein